jgi:hypothetical protein
MQDIEVFTILSWTILDWQMSLYTVEISVSLCFVKNLYVYIPYFNVTSGGIRCSKGTPIIK